MKRNVLYFIWGLGDGGAEHQMLQLAQRMILAGHSVHIGCLLREGELVGEAEQIIKGPIADFPIRSFYDQTMLAQLARFRSYLRQNRIEIVHTQDFYSNIFGMIGAHLARVPARIAFKGETEFARTRAQLFAERCAFRASHAVIANSHAVRDQLIGAGVNSEKVITIYNGIDLDRVAPDPHCDRAALAASFGLPDGPDLHFVTLVANMHHRIKDHPVFLRAAQKVKRALPNTAFVIAGQGRLRRELESYAADLGLAGDVFFTGRCDRVADLLAVSSVGVLSSKAEGFSNSILEYMAAGLPVVATDAGGAREVIVEGETGYVVQPGDDEAMAQQLIELLRHPHQARLMGRCGRNYVVKRFSWETQVGVLQEFYDVVLGSSSKPMSVQKQYAAANQ